MAISNLRPGTDYGVLGVGAYPNISGSGKFNVTNFLAEVREKGLAKPSRFEITIQNPSVISDPSWGQKVSMFVDSGFFPLQRLLTSRQQLFGPPEFLPVGIDLGGDNFTLNIICDRNMEVKKYFDMWVNGIVDRQTGLASYRMVGGSPVYTSTIEVAQLDENNSVTYAVRLYDVYPVAVNPLAIDNNLKDTVHRLSVSFNYRRWVPMNISPAAAPVGSKTVLDNAIKIQNGNIQYNLGSDLAGGYYATGNAGNGIPGSPNYNGSSDYYFVI